MPSKKIHRDCKITVIIIVFLTVGIIIFAMFTRYTEWLPSKGDIVISIKNELDVNVTYELYIDGDLYQNKIIIPLIEHEYKLELEKGRHAVILIVFGFDWNRLMRERPTIKANDISHVSFVIWEYIIPP